MVLGILNYYFPQSLDYAIDSQPRSQEDWSLNVDLAIRQWYPETPTDYQLADLALVDIKLRSSPFGDED
ncbi:hypothetical protein N7486_010834 [Penicillium sp. IBT 16267x]|nr:hypothetical protein N7486_010834 [Penicillium sp. IBT 16267x]